MGQLKEIKNGMGGMPLLALCLLLILFVSQVIAASAQAVESEKSTAVASEESDYTYEESPWPDFMNVTVFKGTGACFMDFIKFSCKEDGSYFTGHPVLSNLSGWESLPRVGWIYDPETKRSVCYSVEIGEDPDWIQYVGVGSKTVLEAQALLKQDGVGHVDLPSYAQNARPPELGEFLDTLGQKLPAGKLEIIEYNYVPPVWRKTPLYSSIKRMSVEAWNKQVVDAKR